MAEHDDYPVDEFDELTPSAKKGAHRRPSGPLSQGAAIALVTVLAIIAIILVGGTINIIKRSSSNPEAQDGSQIEATATASGQSSKNADAKPSSGASDSSSSVKRDKYDVHVLNASGKAGAAAKMQSQLEDKDWNVTDKANDSSSLKTTTIYYRDKADKAAAQALAKDVGADTSKIKQSSQYSVDLAVVLCSDLA